MNHTSGQDSNKSNIEIEITEYDEERQYILAFPPQLKVIGPIKLLLDYCSSFLHEHYLINDEDNLYITLQYTRIFDLNNLTNQIDHREILVELIDYFDFELVELPNKTKAIKMDYSSINKEIRPNLEFKSSDNFMSINCTENSFAMYLSSKFEVPFIIDVNNNNRTDKYGITFSDSVYYKFLKSPIGLSNFLIENGYSNKSC
jgi:hypothetical protein